MHVLVAGAAGFVGGALARRLATAGHQVTALVRRTTVEPIKGATVHAGGLENVDLLRRLLPSVDVVVHVASGSTPGVSRSAPGLEADLNIAPTLRLLELLQDVPMTRLVYMSSGGTVYGDPEADPVPEDAPLRPRSFYGAGKVAIESFINAFAIAGNRRCTILRPSNLYGPGQPLYAGFGVVRAMLQRALDGGIMEIWGDGGIVRDFLYIDDLIDAFELLLARDDANGTFNVGAGRGHSLNQLVSIARGATGRSLPVVHQSARNIDVRSIVLDHSKITARIGWFPRVELEEGIERTWRWLTR